VQVGAWLTPGATGANTFSLQIKLHNGAGGNAFAMTVNSGARLWASEALR
jgi:hypothetical protein